MQWTGSDRFLSRAESAMDCGSRRDQEEGVELNSHEEVGCFCGSRRNQEEGGGAGPSS